MNSFERLRNFLDQHYYSTLIVGVFEVIAIVTCVLFVPNEKLKYLFLLYLMFDFLILLAYNYDQVNHVFTKRQTAILLSIANNAVALIELSVYYYFFSRVIKKRVVVSLMKICLIAFGIVMFVFLFTRFQFITDRYYHVSELIGVLEFLFLLVPCFTFFYELLGLEPTANIYDNPRFWVTSGIFFYSLISVPYYLIGGFVIGNKHQNTRLLDLIFFYLPFAINFVFLTKAFLFKRSLTA